MLKRLLFDMEIFAMAVGKTQKEAFISKVIGTENNQNQTGHHQKFIKVGLK